MGHFSLDWGSVSWGRGGSGKGKGWISSMHTYSRSEVVKVLQQGQRGLWKDWRMLEKTRDVLRNIWGSWVSVVSRREGSGLSLSTTPWGFGRVGAGPFFCACSEKTRRNSLKLRQWRFRWDISIFFFIVQVVKRWNRLPTEVVEPPSHVMFKSCLNLVMV